jgi:hypothetical protein
MAAVARTESERILFVLDACCDVSDPALEGVVAMAARLDAALEGLFVEDAQLLLASQLPFATEIGRAGGERALEPASLHQAYEFASASLARRLRHSAAARNVRWTLTQAAGSRLAAVIEAAQDQDLLLAARAARTRPALSAAAAYRRVCLLYEREAALERTLHVLGALAANGHTRDVLLYARHTPPLALLERLREAGLRAYTQLADEEAPGARLRTASTLGAGLLIAPRALLAGIPPSARDGRVIETLSVPLLLLR